MTRFREDWYATRTYKALAAGATHKSDTLAADIRARRAQYFQKSLQGRKAIKKALQARMNGI